MPKESFFDSGDVNLHYIDWEGNGQPIVLLAGLGDSAHIFDGLAPRLTERFRVVGLTRRGHGQSERPDSGFDLDTFVEDLRCFLDALKLDRVILVGHSFGGLEAVHFATLYPQRVVAIVYLDALFPPLDPEPDLSGDPIWTVIPVGAPTEVDLVSREAYFAYYRRVRPAWDMIWCKAIESDLMSKVFVRDDGSLVFHHDDKLMNSIYNSAWSSRNPEYGIIEAPMLAIVPVGSYHQSVPSGAMEELRQAADQYWVRKILPWIRQRTKVFLQAAPLATVIELDTPYHHIFIAEEENTAKVINDFWAGEDTL